MKLSLNRQTLSTAALFGIILCSGITMYFISNARVSEAIIVQKVSSELSASAVLPAQVGRPVLLKIPRINADATVEFVGITPQGSMDVPKGPSNVAWYQLGPRPGEVGNAVIAGHYGWKNGIPAVFDDLYKLQSGDKISVEDENGAITTFLVRELRRYGENQDASDVFDSKDGKAHLVLITCEGVWNKAQKSYSNRLVVFADLESANY